MKVLIFKTIILLFVTLTSLRASSLGLENGIKVIQKWFAEKRSRPGPLYRVSPSGDIAFLESDSTTLSTILVVLYSGISKVSFSLPVQLASGALVVEFDQNSDSLWVLGGGPLGQGVYQFETLSGKALNFCKRSVVHGSRMLVNKKGLFLIEPLSLSISGQNGWTVSKADFTPTGCRLKKIYTTTAANEDDFAAASMGDGSLLLLVQRNYLDKGQGRKSVSIEIIDSTGIRKHSSRIDDALVTPQSEVISVNTHGALVTVWQGDRKNLFLVKNKGDFRFIEEGVLSAVWLDKETILFNKATHASSSELQVRSGKAFQTKWVPRQPEGLKENLQQNGSSLIFSVSHLVKAQRVLKVDIKNERYTDLIFQPTAPLLLPVSQPIVYKSGDRLIPSVQIQPDTKCEDTEKKPAIVYVHGGLMFGYPIGIGPYGGEIEPILFSLAGYIVVTANYYGDLFNGTEYLADRPRYSENDYATKELTDILAAGEFLKHLPCVDSSRIYLYGHSNGATLSSLLLASKNLDASKIFKGAILHGGLYKKTPELSSFEPWSSPRLAVRGSEFRRFYSDPLNVKDSSQFRYVHTSHLYGVKNALAMLGQLESQSRYFYGVEYFLPDSYYARVVPFMFTKHFASIPIYVIHGEEDDSQQALDYAEMLKRLGVEVQTWIASGAHHSFEGQDQIELIQRLKSFFR